MLMKITFDIFTEKFSYESKGRFNNFLLSSNEGTFLNLGAQTNSTKFQGLNFFDKKEFYKIIDEFLVTKDIKEVLYGFSNVKRVFKDESFDEFNLYEDSVLTYETSNKTILDIDVKKSNDFDTWGRVYDVYDKDGIIIVKYSKIVNDKVDYEVFMGIKSNSQPNFIKEWVRKEYEYSKIRNSSYEFYVYRLLEINENSKTYFSFGKSEFEVKCKIEETIKNESKIRQESHNLLTSTLSKINTNKPLTKDLAVAFALSNTSLTNFSKNDNFFAGYPWFNQTWSRDELVSLGAYIENREFSRVREVIFRYINKINSKTGLIKRIESKGSLESPDGVFWLSKRIRDLILSVDENEIHKYFNSEELGVVYSKLVISFHKIVKNNWDRDKELIKPKYGDSWMDTLEEEFPLDIQLGFLNLISTLGVISNMLNKRKDFENFSEFEISFKSNIVNKYLKDGNKLSNSITETKITCNIFVAYYLYKDLLDKETWEKVFNFALKELKTTWGGLSSTSKNDSNFKNEYTGENNLSYHRGDSWFFVNNIAVIALSEVNDKKFRVDINKLMKASTDDILMYGCIGYSSEVSSSIEQRSEGCFAQAWSSATYIEMIRKLF